MKFIKPDTISFRAFVSEADIRERMANEVLEQIGGIEPDGRRRPGIVVKVNRGSSRAGGYTIDVSGPMPVRLLLPRPEEE